MAKAFHHFTGEYAFLSNAYPCEVRLADGAGATHQFASVEHALQACKSSEEAFRATIRAAKDVRTARAAGRAVKLERSAWYALAQERAPALLRDKFRRSRALRSMLAETASLGPIECGEARAGPYWSTASGTSGHGAGKDVLGKMLTAVRDAVRADDGGAVDWARHFFGDKCARDAARLSVEAFRGEESLGTEVLEGDSVHLWGKHAACDVVLAHGSISRQHALLVVAPPLAAASVASASASASQGACAAASTAPQELRVFIVDLGSTHGTFVRASSSRRSSGERPSWIRLEAHVPRAFQPHERIELRFGASTRRFVVEAEVGYVERSKTALLARLANPTEALKVREEDTVRVFVGGLPYGMGVDAIKAIVSETRACADEMVINIHLPMNVETGKSRGFCFLKIGSVHAARRVAGALDGMDAGEGEERRTLSANLAKTSIGGKDERRERKRQRVER